MLDNVWFIAAIWMGLAFVASLISIRLGISVALVEIFIGILAGNFLGINKSTEWVNFLAFYFIKAGLYVSLPALWTSIGVIALLFVMKIASKGIGVLPFARLFEMRNREANYTTLLMSTGLTFGTFSTLFGLNNRIINQSQYTILVTVVILYAVIPTIIAQQFFQPKDEDMASWEALCRKLKKSRRGKFWTHGEIPPSRWTLSWITGYGGGRPFLQAHPRGARRLSN